jgi:sigma-B regulation protein RsbU (phosphoserine phosphatase)
MTKQPSKPMPGKTLTRFLPKTRMGAFAFSLAVLWGLRVLFFPSNAYPISPLLGLFLNLIPLLLVIPAIYYLWKLFSYARNRFLWKISRRLVLAHIFIGAIPVFFVVGIFYFSIVLFYYQLSYFLIFNQIGIHTSRIHAYNLALRDRLHQLISESAELRPSEIKKALEDDSRYLLGSYPSAEILLSYKDPASNNAITYINKNSVSKRIEETDIPQWTKDVEFSGLIVEDHQSRKQGSGLMLRSFVPNTLQSELPFNLEVTVPFDDFLLGRLKSALGQDMVLTKQSEQSGMNIVLPLTAIADEKILYSTIKQGPVKSVAPWMWAIRLYPISWNSGEELDPYLVDALMVEVSIPNLMKNLYRSENREGKLIYYFLGFIVIVFLLAETASIFIGIVLTRSITNAVYNLDRGTQFIKRGDFSQRIIVRSHDQLGALADSFNQMTEYVQHLVKESVKKERLEREIEIAREVQERLFPSQSPQMKHLEIAGVCLPARAISGDYYDFLSLGKNALGIAVGDICGKGIYAALLMANLQATLRSNVMNSWDQYEQERDKAIAGIVERMNAQIFSYTNDNKFATFFYALYDDAKGTLAYCNAGHNPPLHFSGNEIRRLSVGGTVVGIFADSKYEQETIHLSPGDLFVAYTDGITECINEYGEEFGEERLVQLIRAHQSLPVENIKEAIINAALSWKYADEQDDDMTLIIAKML